MTTETLEGILASDIAGRFNISRTEAARIAASAKYRADPAKAFILIWEDQDWWSDENPENDGDDA